jgi:luciferase family oxidoreductase group 1
LTVPKLSILDQSPLAEGDTHVDALRHTIELARKAEEWGYHRFWVAEHHNSERYVGSSPEVLMSHLLANTSRIPIGSGGVMLQHYSPFKVAENFNVLASLAPGRVDLGIGRGPGGLPRTTRALQQEFGLATRPFRDKLVEWELN